MKDQDAAIISSLIIDKHGMAKTDTTSSIEHLNGYYAAILDNMSIREGAYVISYLERKSLITLPIACLFLNHEIIHGSA